MIGSTCGDLSCSWRKKGERGRGESRKRRRKHWRKRGRRWMRRRKRAILIRTMPISKAGAGGGAGALGPGHGTADGPAAITGGVSSAKGSSHSPAKAVVSSQRAAGDGGLGGAGGSSVFQMCHCCESLACYCGCESECLRALCARVGRRARHARQNPGEGSGTRAAQGLPERAGNPGSEAAPDACWATLGLLVCLADSLSDLWLAASFSYAGETRWFALTLFFVLAPSLVVQAVSFRWAAQDLLEVDSRPGLALGTTTRLHVPGRVCRACVWLCQVLLHALQLGQAWRYVRVAYLCARCRRVDGAHLGWALRCELADAARLRLLGAFLQCGPQLVLQLCIMLQRTRTDGTQAMATAVSLLALSWALAAYNKALRDARDDKATMGLARAALQLTWRACTIFSRVVSFALFASIFQVYFGIFVVAHWYLVTFWVIYGGTDFCTSKWEEILFNLAVGVVYIFCWLSVHEGQTCGRMLAYYGLVAAENLTLTLAWFMYRHTASTASFAIPAVLAVVGSFAAGMSCALVYYGLAHPSGRRFRGLPSSCCSEVLDGVPLPPAAQAQQQTTPVVASGDEGLGQLGLGDSDVCPHTWRPSEPLAPVPTTPLPDAAVIRVDMPRKRYPAWEAHHIDRRLRSAIVGLQTSALRAVPSLTTAATVAPVVRYRDGAIYELIEYETTV